MNYSGKIGAVGRDNFLHKVSLDIIPCFLFSSTSSFISFVFFQWRFPFALIKYDVEQGKPLRDSTGLCIQVPKGLSLPQQLPFSWSRWWFANASNCRGIAATYLMSALFFLFCLECWRLLSEASTSIRYLQISWSTDTWYRYSVVPSAPYCFPISFFSLSICQASLAFWWLRYPQGHRFWAMQETCSRPKKRSCTMS